MVIEPLLIDEDYYARVEGREIISNLAKVTHPASIQYKAELIIIANLSRLADRSMASSGLAVR